ncbi:potassium channel family protein [Calidifontibacter terrae]
MHYVIMGCGRVGSSLAMTLEQQGHSVAVIDRDESAFRRLGSSFEGDRITGIGFDRDTLERAGVRNAYAFAAVSSGDNSNILSARVARETFDVEHVVARIYDPGRAEIYQRLGIPTVATVRWTADQVLRRLVPAGAVPIHTDASGTITLAEIPTHPSWIGTPLKKVEAEFGVRVAYVNRLGEGVLPQPNTVLQEGDLLQLLVRTPDMPTIEQRLGSARPSDF